MTLEFINLDAKTQQIFDDVPPKMHDHTYLEVLLKDRLESGDAKLYTAKMYEGVNADDLTKLKEQGIHLIMSSGKTAYLADEKTAEMLKGRMFQNFSDAVAYGSIPISPAASSLVQPKARVLVIDDEAKGGPDWGSAPILKADGSAVDQAALVRAANSLGDCYGLVSRDLHGSLNAQQIVEGAAGKVAISQVATLEGGLSPDEINSAIVMGQIADTLGITGNDISYRDEDIQLQTRRDGTQVAKWQVTQTLPDGSDQVLQGKTLIEATVAGGSKLTTVGGTEDQKKVVDQTFYQVTQSYDTPFQFRAGVPEWQGVMKGTARTSDLCRELGVDAIIPKSSIKGDGKTVQVGIQEVDNLYWARKSDAASREQKLGAQVLVNLPEGTRTDVMPKLKEQAEELAKAQTDPRKLADLYIAKAEKRAQFIEQDSEGGEDESAQAEERVDWLYEVLKADARPTTVVVGLGQAAEELNPNLSEDGYRQLTAIAQSGLAISDFLEQANPVFVSEGIEPWTVENVEQSTVTETRGGYGQLLEHDKVVEGLQKFAQGEWKDIALGGIYVPSAMAQPHGGLRQSNPENGVLGEICAPDLPHGAKIAVYRSPVANVAAFRVFENNLEGLKGEDIEAFRQSGVMYMNPNDAKELVIDFDGDTVAMIPEEGFERLHAEVMELNSPDKKPVQVEKEKKIPRNANDPAIASLPPQEQAMAKRFTSIEVAAVDAADNPTGSVANTLMKLEALRWETQYVFDRESATNQLQAEGVSAEQIPQMLLTREVEVKQEYLGDISKHFQKMQKQMSNSVEPLIVPEPTKEGFDFRKGITEIAQSSRSVTASDPAKRLEQIDKELGNVERFLFQVEGIAAVNLQRAVDTPKSARVVDEQEFEFCKTAVRYKDVEWVAHKKDPDLFLGGKEMPTNTQDPVGWMAVQANQTFEVSGFDKQSAKVYDGLFLAGNFTPEQAVIATEVVQQYNSTIATSIEIDERAKTEEGPALQLKMAGGRTLEVTNLTRFDPKGTSPIWEMGRHGTEIEVSIVKNSDFKTEKTHSYAVSAMMNGEAVTIGTLSEKSQIDFAKANLKAEDPKRLTNLEKKFADNPQALKKELKGVDIKSGATGVASLFHQRDKEDAKELRVTAHENLQSWVKTIPEEDKASWSAALWHNRGQKVAMMVTPDQVQAQLAEAQFTQTTIAGMDFEQTNEWHGHEWNPQETVPVRFAIGTEQTHYDPSQSKDHPHYGSMVLQAQRDGEWKTIAPANSNNEYYQMPVGTVAMATIALRLTENSVATAVGSEQPLTFTATTAKGSTVKIQPLEGVVIPPKMAITFLREGAQGIVATATEPPERIGLLTQADYQKITAIEQQSGKAIFDNPKAHRNVEMAVVPETVALRGLAVKPLGEVPISSTPDGQTQRVQFVKQMEQGKPKYYLASTTEPNQKLGELNKTAIRDINKIEEQGIKVWNNPQFTREVAISPEPVKSAQITLDPSSIKIPEVWTRRNDPQAWEATISGIREAEVAASRAVGVDQGEVSRAEQVATREGELETNEQANPLSGIEAMNQFDEKITVADLGARNNLSEMDLGELFKETDRVGDKYLSAEEIAQNKAELAVHFDEINQMVEAQRLEPSDPKLSTLLEAEGTEGQVARDLKEAGFVLTEQDSRGGKQVQGLPNQGEDGYKATDKQFVFGEKGWTMSDINGNHKVTDIGQIADVVDQLKVEYLDKSKGIPEPAPQNQSSEPQAVITAAPLPAELGLRTDTPQAVITIEGGETLVANLYEQTVSDVQQSRTLKTPAICLEKDFHEAGDIVVMIQDGLVFGDIGELTPESKIRLSEIETQVEKELTGNVLPIEQIQVTNVPERAIAVEQPAPTEKSNPSSRPVPQARSVAELARAAQSTEVTEQRASAQVLTAPTSPPLTPIQQAMQERYDQRREAAVTMFKSIGVEQVTAEQIDLQIAKSIHLTTPRGNVEQEMVVLGRSPVTQALKASSGVEAAQGYVNKVWQASTQVTQKSSPVRKDSGR